MVHWLDKIWESNTVYEEPVCFLSSGKAGKQDSIEGDLLFTPTKVLKVESYDGSRTYVEGIDYYISGKRIHRTTNSNIPCIDRDAICVPYLGAKETDWLRIQGGDYYFKIFPEIYQYQVLVTYEHNEKWEGFVPQSRADLLPRSTGLLSAKKPINLVFYGDSITAGWEASGCDEHVIDMYTLNEFHLTIKRPPYLPAWSTLVTNALRESYGYEDIIKTNRGAGGSTSTWGSTNADSLVNPHNPDLVILAFGMNNLQDDPQKYEEDILQIITIIRSKHPDCEFLLVSPMIPNPEIRWLMNNKLLKHQEALFHLQETMTGVAVAPVHTMFLELIKYDKNYMDVTGNCINHPNDFAVRVYAQTILSALGV